MGERSTRIGEKQQATQQTGETREETLARASASRNRAGLAMSFLVRLPVVGRKVGRMPGSEHHKGRIKTRLPLLCPTGCLFPQTQIFQPESPTHLTTFQPNPTRILPAALARCCFCSCSHTFAWPRCPLIPRPHISHLRLLLLLFLPQATHTQRTCSLHTHHARGSPVVQQLSLCSLSTVQPGISSATRILAHAGTPVVF